MMRHVAALLALAPALSWATCPEGFPEGLTCTTGTFVTGTAPPVEPPPVEPPIEPPPEPPPGSVAPRARFDSMCERDETGAYLDPDILSCRTWDSPADVYASSNMRRFEWTGVPNSPNRPKTNGKCAWNTPEPVQPCYPAFGSDADAQGRPGIETAPGDYTCEHRAAIEAELGHSQDSVLAASLRSPCYYVEAPGAVVMSDWADLGSSIQHIGIADWPARPAVKRLYYEYEIAIGPSMFRERKGSYTSKLARVEQVKGECPDARLIDERFLAITPEQIDIGYAYYCRVGGGDSYSPPEATLTLAPDDALRWVRISRELDTVAGRLASRAVDPETGAVLLEHVHEVEMIGPMTLDFARLLLHSTSHQRCTDDCDRYLTGHFAVRHVLFAGTRANQ